MIFYLANQFTRIKKIVKFGTTGVVCVFIDFIVVYYAYEILGFNKYYSNIVGTCVALLSNYIINRTWTFKSKSPWKKEFSKFMLFATVGIILNNIIVYYGSSILTKYLQALHDSKTTYGIQTPCIDYVKAGFYSAKITAVGIVFFWNFFINSKFNFK